MSALPVQADWTTYHLDQGRSGNDTSEGVSPSPTSAWTSAALDGQVYAEPLVIGSTLIVATENNTVYALNASTGAVQWSKNLGTAVPNSALPCGLIDPMGITSTPVADTTAGILYVVGSLWTTGQKSTIHYQLFALNLNNSGAILWQRTIAPSNFNAYNQGQRSALLLANGNVYIPFGGRNGDCNTYYGWVVGAPTSSSTAPLLSFQLPTPNAGGGIWAASGGSIDEAGNLYVTTGNTNCNPGCPFDYGEAVLKLSPSLSLLDYFSPSNWATLNQFDVDVGGTGPAVIDNGHGGLIFQVGKDGNGFLIRANHMGHVNGQLYGANACPGLTGDAAFGGTAYAVPYVYVPCSDGVVALKVSYCRTPSFTVAWHGPSTSLSGPPILAAGLVWTIDGPSTTLYGLDPITGATRFQLNTDGGNHFATPAASGGQLFVPAGNVIDAFNLGATALPSSVGTGAVVASSWGSGRLDLFKRGADAALWHSWFDGTCWSNWESLGGVLTSDPAAVSWAPGRIDVFARGADSGKTLFHKWFQNNWSGWESLGGSPATSPAVSSWGQGRLDLFYTTTTGSLQHNWFSGNWGNWEDLSGQLASGPSAVSWGNGRIDVFGQTQGASTLSHLWFSGNWSSWQTLGGSIASQPAVASWGAGRLDVFARGTDNSLQHLWFSGSWQPWEGLGGTLASAPGVASWGSGRLDVFDESGPATTGHKWFSNPAWSSWEDWLSP